MKILKEKINFDNYKTSLVVIKFWTNWCSPCLSLDPKLEEFSKNTSNKVTVLKVDADVNQDIISDWVERWLFEPFMSIPQTFIFKDWKKIWWVTWDNLLEIKEICEKWLS